METIPIVVEYHTVRGGVVFHAPSADPLDVESTVTGAVVSKDRAIVGGGHDSDDVACNEHNAEAERGEEVEESELISLDETRQAQQRPQRRCRVVDDIDDNELLPEHGALKGEPPRPLPPTPREGQRNSEQQQEKTYVAVHQRDVPVRLGLDNAFPGRPAVSTVSLRSSAQGSGLVQGMESSGPLLQTVLTRRDMPGVGMQSSELEEALLPGEELYGAPVEVRRIW